MQLSTNQTYKHKDIKVLLKICPVCSSADSISIWSTMTTGSAAAGKEGITCNRCRLDLSFSFKMDSNNEIIDEYLLDYFKIGNLEFKNDNKQLALYLNNTYVKDIDNNIVDIDKCKSLVLLS
jgi:hypothetical protein